MRSSSIPLSWLALHRFFSNIFSVLFPHFCIQNQCNGHIEENQKDFCFVELTFAINNKNELNMKKKKKKRSKCQKVDNMTKSCFEFSNNHDNNTYSEIVEVDLKHWNEFISPLNWSNDKWHCCSTLCCYFLFVHFKFPYSHWFLQSLLLSAFSHKRNSSSAYTGKYLYERDAKNKIKINAIESWKRKFPTQTKKKRKELMLMALLIHILF